MDIYLFVLLILGGFVAGTFGALLGLGGAAMLIPFLVLVVNVPMHQAIATSIISVIATSTAGAVINLERNTVHIRLGMLLEIATVVGAILGGISANYLSPNILTKIFSFMLLFVSAIMLLRFFKNSFEEKIFTDGSYPQTFYDDKIKSNVAYTVKNIPALMTVSFFAGNISGMLGVGGGIFKVPAMNILSRVPIKAATSTSNFMIGVTAAASAFIYFAHGHLNLFVTACATLGVFVGSFFGVVISKKIHSKILTLIFAIALCVISVQLFFKFN